MEIPSVITHLNTCLQRSREKPVLEAAARAFGKLALLHSSVMAELADIQVKNCLEWLDKDNPTTDSRRHAAVIVLAVLAENAPSIFYTHVENYLQVI